MEILRPTGWHKGKIIVDDDVEPRLFTPIYPARIKFGKPAQIAQAKETKLCPRCNFRLDIGVENGVVFGGLCHACGWSF